MADDDGAEVSEAEQKHQLKLQRRQEKQARKLARKQEKSARKAARGQPRMVVGYRSSLDRAEASRVIEELVAGLKAGKVCVEHDDQQLTIEPPDAVKLRVKARQTGKTQGLTIRVSWPRLAVTEEPAESDVGAG
jgi:amphi-Trp domain-containing protein